MKRVIALLLVAVITSTVKGQTVFDSFDSAVESNYVVSSVGNSSDSSRVYPFQEKQIVHEGQGALRLQYTVESIATWGGAAILRLRHPDATGVWDFSGYESLSVAFYNKLPCSWPGRAHMRIHLYDASNVNVATTPLSATEWWYSFHRVLDRDKEWYEIVLPLKDVGSTADDGEGGTGFWLTGWAGILGNSRLDLDQIRGIGIEVFINGPLDHEFIRGEFIFDNLTLNPKPTSVHSSEQIPKRFALEQSYPNPFRSAATFPALGGANSNTIIRYEVPKAAQVELAVYNLLGEKIRTLVQAKESAGLKQATWDGRNERGERVSSGVYLYRLEAGEFTRTRRLMLTR